MNRIVICGSMRFEKKMIEIKEKLMSEFEVVLPNECNMKCDETTLSKMHFNEIANENTKAILVINGKKGEKDNYIGLHTFSEIGIAFFKDKKIYLLNDYYEPYKEELEIWHAIPINGDLSKIERK